MKYIIGSDRKTVLLAREWVSRINAQMDSGNFTEAEKLIETAMSSSNRPFLAEFAHQSEVNAG